MYSRDVVPSLWYSTMYVWRLQSSKPFGHRGHRDYPPWLPVSTIHRRRKPATQVFFAMITTEHHLICIQIFYMYMFMYKCIIYMHIMRIYVYVFIYMCVCVCNCSRTVLLIHFLFYYFFFLFIFTIYIFLVLIIISLRKTSV